MILTLFAYWVVALPVGYSLAMFPLWQGKALGAYGFWLGLVVGLVSPLCYLMATQQIITAFSTKVGLTSSEYQ